MQGPVPKRASFALRAQRRFAASPERVFQAWTDPEKLKRWWCPPGWAPAAMEVDLRVGGTYRLGMRRCTGEGAVFVQGRFLEVRVPERLVYTWKWEGAFEEMSETRITVDFIPVNGGTEVQLVQDGFPTPGLRQQHLVGWVAACDRMEKIV